MHSVRRFFDETRAFHFEADKDGAGGGVANPEFVTDPDTGAKVPVSSLFEMRRSATAKYDEAAEMLRQANATNERVSKVVDMLTAKAQAAEGTPAKKTDDPLVKADDLDALDEGGFQEFGKRTNDALKQTSEQLEARLKADLEASLDERDWRLQVSQRNQALLDAHLKAEGIDGRLRSKYVEELKSTPRTSDYGHTDDRGYFHFNEKAIRRVDLAVRGDEIIAAREAKARQEGMKNATQGLQAGGLGAGGGAANLKDLPIDERIAALEDLPPEVAEHILYNEMSDEEVSSLITGGFDLQLQERQRGRSPHLARR